uniref:Uncharacterized protein n=1 Tax=Arundo donax TaxID=35708 RepID=A0A0A9BEF3_ARUDO
MFIFQLRELLVSNVSDDIHGWIEIFCFHILSWGI